MILPLIVLVIAITTGVYQVATQLFESTIELLGRIVEPMRETTSQCQLLPRDLYILAVRGVTQTKYCAVDTSKQIAGQAFLQEKAPEFLQRCLVSSPVDAPFISRYLHICRFFTLTSGGADKDDELFMFKLGLRERVCVASVWLLFQWGWRALPCHSRPWLSHALWKDDVGLVVQEFQLHQEHNRFLNHKV